MSKRKRTGFTLTAQSLEILVNEGLVPKESALNFLDEVAASHQVEPRELVTRAIAKTFRNRIAAARENAANSTVVCNTVGYTTICN